MSTDHVIPPEFATFRGITPGNHSYWSLEQVSELFSDTLFPRLPKLFSASLRIFISDSNPPTRITVAPPELQHLELFMNWFSFDFTRGMLKPLLPVVGKVRHLGWFGFSDDMDNIIRERLGALTTLETMEQTLWHFGSFPSDVMAYLIRLIVHEHQSSYSVELRKVYVTIGQSFSIHQAASNQYDQYQEVLYGTPDILHSTDMAEIVEVIQNSPGLREVGLDLTEFCKSGLLEIQLLPLLSTMKNLEKVYILTGEPFACCPCF